MKKLTIKKFALVSSSYLFNRNYHTIAEAMTSVFFDKNHVRSVLREHDLNILKLILFINCELITVLQTSLLVVTLLADVDIGIYLSNKHRADNASL